MAMMCKTGKGSLVIRGQINNNDLHAEIRDAVVLSGVTSINGKTNTVVLTADDVEAISYSKQQNLTPEQQLLARTNIGAVDKGYIDSVIDNLEWNDAETLNLLIEEDMLPAVHTADEAILTDQNGNIVLRY